jgi:alpha-L-rhamnosidase
MPLLMNFPSRLVLRSLLLATLGMGATLGMPARSAVAATRVVDVRTEYLTDPLGLDVARPRFSWVVENEERGARQTAYRVQVASDAARLKKGEGDVWDSGRVTSGDNVQVVYAGPALAPRTRYHVRVQVWDHKDRPALSAPAFFETGFLDKQDWKARFIGLRPASDGERWPFVGARWMAPPEAIVTKTTKRLGYVSDFTVAPDEKLARADLFVVGPSNGDPWKEEVSHFLWVSGTTFRKWAADINDPRQMDITRAVKPGPNRMHVLAPFIANTGFITTVRLRFTDGRERFVQSDATWRVRSFDAFKPGDAWRAEDPGKAPFVPVKVLGAFGEDIVPGDSRYVQIDRLLPAAVLRKTFNVAKPVAQARLYVTAAGVYEMRMNGKRVGNDVLAPGWTDYRKRLRYQTYDVTALVGRGPNAIGALVGDGWYAGRTGMGQALWGFEKALLAELHVTYRDGTADVIATDETWRGQTGTIRRSDMLDGETQDARLALGAWDIPAYDQTAWRQTAWRPVSLPAIKIGVLEGQMDPAVRVTRTLATRAVTRPAPGVQIFDLGQNMTGWIQLRLAAPRGTRVTIRYAETLNKDGTMFTENLRTALVVDEYIAAGRGQELFEPRFTFHGFRYVEVTGIDKPLAATAVRGMVVHNALAETGTFSTSNPLLDRLQSNIVWGQRGNFLSVPTDCPQRDERLGWTGDIQLFARTATFNMDAAAFLSKFVIDMEDGQYPDGQVPHVAPTSPGMGGGAYGWGDAIVILPYLLYQVYGDTRVIERHMTAMMKWVDFRTSKARNDLNEEWSFGDWVSPPPETPNKVLGPVFHARAAWLVSRMAAVIGKKAESEKYAALFERIKKAWNAAHVAPDGKIGTDTQTTYVMALRYEMLPPERRKAAADHLAAAIARHKGHLNTGFLGTGHLLPALSMEGRDEVAFDLLLKQTYPSWLFTVQNGATTMWERWDSYSPEKGPSNVGDMNSYNHYAFGAVGEWMYGTITGIDHAADAVGFSRIVLGPRKGGALTRARGRYRSVRGTIESSWRDMGNAWVWDVVVPVHATALAKIPAGAAASVREGGVALADAAGVKVVGERNGVVEVDLVPGRYRFTARP